MRDRRKLKSNRAKCGACGEIIASYHRHDFVRCGCGKTFVDGGLNYLRRGFSDAGYEDLSEYCTVLDEFKGHCGGLLDSAALIQSGKVTVNGDVVSACCHEVKIGDVIDCIGSVSQGLPHIVEDNEYEGF